MRGWWSPSTRVELPAVLRFPEQSSEADERPPADRLIASAIFLVPGRQKISRDVVGLSTGRNAARPSGAPSVFVPSPWAWSPQYQGCQGESGYACRYSTIAAWSYASRHPTSRCRRQRRGHAGWAAALGALTASAALPLGGPRLRADGGSEMLGCRLATLRRRLLRTNLQRWSEQETVQLLDWSRSQGRGVAWEGSRTPENAQRRQCISWMAGH
jgi:hypothetical protein